ncbi:hypothetical protein Q4Q34_18755 [Flavivirga abyssicola]|uniref:hypothetical protein n=1 Tax=Flavivirga abyssicola TaxID=3063533 RepID=UPI0026DEEA1E|nr:hypothetical protein [Flavivirga sp. MEBiC07777]WVK13257.1 hypothetical protein Q4Q34_18755 [Flavivirga sp. MEBiC07777]
MRIKKFLRFLMLLIFIIIASIVPFPIKFYKKDNLPSYEIEQIDKKDDDENTENDYQAFS